LELKQQIEKRFGVKTSEQKIYNEGILLQPDDATFSALGLK
jgi:hypothetical protein